MAQRSGNALHQSLQRSLALIEFLGVVPEAMESRAPMTHLVADLISDYPSPPRLWALPWPLDLNDKHDIEPSQCRYRHKGYRFPMLLWLELSRLSTNCPPGCNYCGTSMG
ncbi:hypothetical protein BS47DRAFT_766069 [Hydnum rufescens UP504]|uniref:Uncharacterized protein n=1 Tax=Hydnum rufescens UP504 TaxID=1448309 RepID=A0A9P6BCW1_9AGAM|nr:hypothetical protein BS47DRAFT_766069 [Hydnum rufescens UP504]